MSVGVVLTRAQPFHLGHIDVVKQALDDNDKVVLVIGSANKSGTKRNPLSISDRLLIVEEMLRTADLPIDRIDILELVDWSMEDAYKYAKEWGSFFYYNVVNKAQCKEFTFYYNDNIDTVKNWFNDELSRRINIKNSKRIRDVSATKVREAVFKDDYDYIIYALGSLKFYRIIKHGLDNCDKKDFIMK